MGLLERASTIRRRPELQGGGLLARALQFRDTDAPVKRNIKPIPEKKNGTRNRNLEDRTVPVPDPTELLPGPEPD